MSPPVTVSAVERGASTGSSERQIKPNPLMRFRSDRAVNLRTYGEVRALLKHIYDVSSPIKPADSATWARVLGREWILQKSSDMAGQHVTPEGQMTSSRGRGRRRRNDDVISWLSEGRLETFTGALGGWGGLGASGCPVLYGDKSHNKQQTVSHSGTVGRWGGVSG